MKPMAKITLTLAAGACLLALVGTAGAAPPEDAEWGSITLEGAPVDAGFLDDGSLVYATGDTDPTPGTETACSPDTGTAELFLLSFPDGPGCRQAIDVTGAGEGIEAMASASQGARVLVALPFDGSQALASDNLVLYEQDEGNLSETWSDTVNGQIHDVALEPSGDRSFVVFQTGEGSHRLLVLSPAGNVQTDTRLPGQARDLQVSTDGRYVAVGGNFTEGTSSLGWAHLYDLSAEDAGEPVIERTIQRPRAGIVTSLALTDDGTLYAGLLDGTARWIREGGNDREVSLGTEPAHLGLSADGSLLFATSGNESARLDVRDNQLETRWRARLNGTSQDALVRPPHLFAVAETVNALGPDGDRLWETRTGDVVAANQTGLGLALASETGGGGAGSPTISVVEGRVLQRNLSLEQQASIVVTPGGVNRANVTLENVGAAILNVTPTAKASGLNIEASPESLQILPEESRRVSFTVSADRDASPGERSIPIDVNARPSVETDARLDVEVTAQPNVTVELAGGEIADRDVTQGQTVNVRLDVRNRGNAEATVELGILQSVDNAWPTDLSPGKTLTIPAGSLTTARVEITVPAGVPNGTENRIIVHGESDQRASAVQLNLTVNPFQVVRIRPDTVSQEMAPGATTPYDLTVENLGSVEADVRLRLQPLDADGEPCLPTAWGLSLGASRVTVPSQGSRPVRVQITPPAEIPVPEIENGTAGCSDDAQRPSLRVELQGSLDDGSGDSSILFANVDPSLAEEPDDRNEESFPGLAVLIAVLSLSAAAVRGANP